MTGGMQGMEDCIPQQHTTKNYEVKRWKSSGTEFRKGGSRVTPYGATQGKVGHVRRIKATSKVVNLAT